ncbi:DUF3429 domain-containing protein [Hydrogenophaga sp.]|jgi:hypothetical protein|uniref:DUF3429 domain-containing protein n=2 Tax=Hydrogenophaga sp. TaxID=1904254 RepID=UPI00262A9416|nr:DUF3429 domain-containing protein [Hydrogenophaga sp.]
MPLSMPLSVAAGEHREQALIRHLGHAGLIPLVGLALLVWLVTPDLQPWVALALAAYAALIASFLGGIHWGIGWSQMARGPDGKVHFIWGVLPSLLAWPGLVMPPYAGLAWLGLVLIICYLVDRKLYPPAGLAVWLKLRFRLSAIASLSCFIGAGAL